LPPRPTLPYHLPMYVDPTTPMPQIPVRRSLPDADAHLEAVRAALLDGRLDVVAWAARARLTEPVARSWAKGGPVEDSWEGHAWAAAVTTTIPGWATHMEAMGPFTVSDDALRMAKHGSVWESLLASARLLHRVGALDTPSLDALEAKAAAVRAPFAPPPEEPGFDASA